MALPFVPQPALQGAGAVRAVMAAGAVLAKICCPALPEGSLARQGKPDQGAAIESEGEMMHEQHQQPLILDVRSYWSSINNLS